MNAVEVPPGPPEAAVAPPKFDLAKEVQAQLAEMRRESFENFPPESLAWLALPPAWTESLAKTCGFPVKLVGDFIASTHAFGLCAEASEAGSDGRAHREFWMPEAARVDVLADLQRTMGTRFLHEQAVKIAAGIIRADQALRAGETRSSEGTRFFRKQAVKGGTKREALRAEEPPGREKEGTLPAEIAQVRPVSPVLIQWASLVNRTAEDFAAGAA